MPEGQSFDQKGHSNEELERKLFLKDIAQKILDVLGYGDFPRRIIENMEGMGVESAIDDLLKEKGQPTPKDFTEIMANRMERIPNGAIRLLNAAGIPDRNNPTKPITSLRVAIAEPSTTEVHEGLNKDGSFKSKRWRTNIAGTNDLVARVLSGLDILPPDKRGEDIIYGSVETPIIEKGPIRMTLERPLKDAPRTSDQKASYSYRLAFELI